mgnify:CR=1 FL=1
MRSALLQNRWLVPAALLLGVVLGLFAAPVWRMLLVEMNSSSYAELTYLCDSAMRAHDIERARTAAQPSAEQVENLREAELALIDCQDYDMLQKRLMMLGLRESELGLM